MTHALPAQQASIAEIVDGPAPTEVKHVVERLDALQAVMDTFNGRPGNPVASFNRLYRIITDEVDQRLRRPGGFENPDFMTILDIRFAGLYFDAVREWNNRTAKAPRCWSALFNKWNSNDLAPIIGTLAGVTAHIRFDLGVGVVLAFRDVRGSVLEASEKQVSDYRALNEIFRKQIPVLRRELVGNNPIAGAADYLSGIWDDVVQSAGLTLAREESWQRAERLWKLLDRPQQYEAEIRDLDEETESIIKRVFGVLDNRFGNWIFGPWGRPLFDGD